MAKDSNTSVTQRRKIDDPEIHEAFKDIEKTIDGRKRSVITSTKPSLSKAEVLQTLSDDQIIRDANGNIYYKFGNKVMKMQGTEID